MTKPPISRRTMQLFAAIASLGTAVALLPGAVGVGAEVTVATPSPLAHAGGDRHALDVPGLSEPSYDVLLVTGDRVTLTSTGDRYSVTTETAPRADGHRPAIEVDARTDRSGEVTSLTATPIDLQGAVASGVVDPAFFDISWLLDRGDDATGALSVTLKYDDLGADELRSRAGDLPGTSVSSVTPATNTVDVRIDPRRAAEFWAVVAGDLGFGDAAAYLFEDDGPQLSAGVRAIWPTGRRTPTGPTNDTEEPTHTVTMTITKKIGDPFHCVGAGDRVWILCIGIPALISIDGRAPGTVHDATEGRCLEPETCSAIEITYEVPDGKYMSAGLGLFKLDSRLHYLDLLIPEFDVSGDTRVRFDGDRATQATVGTPQPNEQYDGVWASFRTWADGRGGHSGLHTAWGHSNYWAVPSSRVTVGSFHLSQVWILGKPMVTMSVTAPTQRTLHPLMPGYEPGQSDKKIARFTGRDQVELVDGGLGRAEDFEDVDAEGKLVLMQLDVGAGDGVECDMREAPLERAEQAGAVGVVVDPYARGGPFPERECDLPVLTAAWFPNPREVPDLPYAAIPRREAQHLRSLLAEGEVEIDLAGYAGASPYSYLLSLYQQGRIPRSMHTTLTARDLRSEDTRYHGTRRATAEHSFAAWNPLETVVGGLIYAGLPEPARLTINRGPVAPDVVWRQWHDSGAPHSSTRLDVVERRGRQDVHWNAAPAAPGVVTLPPEVFAAQPGKWEDGWAVEVCTFCREGDTFYPTLNLVTGAAPGISSHVYAFTPDRVRLIADGRELSQDQDFLYGPSYELPRRATDYQLTGASLTSRTSWTFRSARRDQTRAPRGYLCPSWYAGDPTIGCQAEPLLFLRYRIRTDLQDAVVAGTRRTLVVSAYRAGGVVPKIARMRLFVSGDSGETWQRLRLRSRGDGKFAAPLEVPLYRQTDGALAFKVSARAADGSTIRQTIREAVAVERRR